MITSRSLDDLIPPVKARAEQFLALCHEHGLDILVTCTYRDMEAQARLYAQGRSLPGQIVTYAQPGDSWHNWRRAFDIVPLRAGKPVWSIRGHDKDLWMLAGRLGQSVGLEWGGEWDRHPDYPHFQDKTGRTLYGLKKEAGLIK
ncbi:MAG TPA: M15 family metallopeptidase [Nitrospira sp.]